ncbi:ABC-2 type transport system ATP-binding protein [Natranaerovirga pectinivora]|uniref:ABC-2 type transport system ATP-binding protein n=1 Tax=Natranaerovirga pectinivora TaxID=682400 RepID=A0A4V2V0E5_9FIRM|nr:ABC transporter ATP-binding protein [Natranaerovirga pectinivora]TCT15560.1 ABC-2 type transport system ATP-binding protein [Natranaerovirga pectinivora]
MLTIKNLYKSYGKFLALDNLNLEIKRGEIFGFVGPNGAGKTTTMRIVSGLLKADSGEVYVDGVNAMRDTKALKEKIGYMPDFFGVYDNLKAIEYLEFYASIYKIVGSDARQICLDLLELVNLSDKANTYVDSLSRGMKQRLCLARCLVHNPELLILDEPASGMDPRARYEMKEILKNLKELGKTIIVSSHILPELAEVCSKVGIIDKGRLMVSGTVDEIMYNMNHMTPLKIKVLRDTEKAVKFLKEQPNIDHIKVSDSLITANFNGGEDDTVEMLQKLIKNEIPVLSFGQEAGNLETLFIQITDNEVEKGAK